MEIKVVQDVKTIDADILVVNMFEGEKTVSELANKYAIEQDNFKGKSLVAYSLLVTIALMTPAVHSGRKVMERPPLSKNVNISLVTMSLLSPAERANNSVASYTGTEIGL